MSIFALAAGLETTLRDRPLIALPILFAAGLGTSLTPCMYPMTVSYTHLTLPTILLV